MLLFSFWKNWVFVFGIKLFFFYNLRLAQEAEIRKLREEVAALETKVHELEKSSIILSSQLALKTQQLKLTETAKEQEITALQFQLNSEVLKYERALKVIK